MGAFPQGLVQGYMTVAATGKCNFRQNFTAEAPEALVDLLKDGDAQLPCVHREHVCNVFMLLISDSMDAELQKGGSFLEVT